MKRQKPFVPKWICASFNAQSMNMIIPHWPTLNDTENIFAPLKKFHIRSIINLHWALHGGLAFHIYFCSDRSWEHEFCETIEVMDFVQHFDSDYNENRCNIIFTSIDFGLQCCFWFEIIRCQCLLIESRLKISIHFHLSWYFRTNIDRSDETNTLNSNQNKYIPRTMVLDDEWVITTMRLNSISLIFAMILAIQKSSPAHDCCRNGELTMKPSRCITCYICS